MASISQKERRAMPQLVWDCMQYNLEEKEAMIYINNRLGRDTTGTIKQGKFRGISVMTYYYYKRLIKRGTFTQNWLNEFTKIGYVISHHKLITAAENALTDIQRHLFMEREKPWLQQDAHLLMQLHDDLRQQIVIINKLNDTTPVVAQVRQILERQNAEPTTESRETPDSREHQSVVPSVE